MNSFWPYLRDRLTEKSTWASLITIAVGALGVTVAPGQVEAISLGIIAVLALIGVITPEPPK